MGIGSWEESPGLGSQLIRGLTVTLADAKADLNELPSTIGRVLETYSNSEHKGRKAAQRTKRPLYQMNNDSNYGLTLRPGITISCEAHEGNETLSTAGIAV